LYTPFDVLGLYIDWQLGQSINHSNTSSSSSSMSVYKSFAVVGGGTVGLPIVNALAAKDVAVVLLSRPGSSKKTVPSNVQIVEVDFADAAAVAEKLKQHKVDVVLATTTTTAAGAQNTLVDAAKLAAVKLFVPSEYGMPTEGHSEGPLGAKAQIAGQNIAYSSPVQTHFLAAYLKSVGIPSTRIYVSQIVYDPASD
jgi:hypothetical protein